MRDNRLDIVMLIAIGIGAIVGTGAYNMPSELAIVASPLAIMIGWGVTFVGVMCLASILRILAHKKPEIKGGHFGYAREGFGNFAGGMIGWGYYVSTIFTLIAGHIAISEVLVYFFGIFNGGTHNLENVKLAISTIAVWLVYVVITSSAEDIGIASIITTISKVIPLIIFVAIVFTTFSPADFTDDFYGRIRSDEIGSVYKQVESLASINIWLVLGFEVIGILSGRAKSMKDVGNATIISVLFAIILYILISIGSLGVMTTEELSLLPLPSMAQVLGSVIGNRGEIIIHFAILISAIGALIAWSFAAVEILFQASREGLFVNYFGKETNYIPKRAALMTSILVQLILLFTFFYPSTYKTVYLVATSSALIPYLISTLYAIKVIVADHDYPKVIIKTRDLILAIVTVVFILWLLLASKLVSLLSVMLIYAVGVVIYTICMKLTKGKIFDEYSGVAALIIFVSGVFAGYVLFIN